MGKAFPTQKHSLPLYEYPRNSPIAKGVCFLLYLLFLLAELILLLAICLPLAFFAPLGVALVLIVVLLAAVIFLHPAKQLSLYYKARRRRVERRFRPRPVPDGITLRPTSPNAAANLTPAEVFRLMELTGAVPKDRLPVADFTATLLDLNRRGILSMHMSEGEGADFLPSDGIRIVIGQINGKKALAPHEMQFLHLLRRAGGPASSVQLSAFAEFVNRSPSAAHRETDAFRLAVDKSLRQKKCLGYIKEHKKRTKNGVVTTSIPRRVCIITRYGEQLAAMWRTYYKNICAHPFIDSYQTKPGAGQKRFADEAEQLLVDAAACGCCARAAEALMREYLFEPMELWPQTKYFSSLTETRYAFADSDSGETYFFMPLRRFETAIQTAVLHGTSVIGDRRLFQGL